jgi:hypothetical protein
MHLMSDQAIKRLKQVLRDLASGPIVDPGGDGVLRLLQDCWSELSGSSQTSMEAYKLSRAEKWDWTPPILSFQIARHGATVFGSTREHLFTWRINVISRTAAVEEGTFRLVHPTAPRLSNA